MLFLIFGFFLFFAAIALVVGIFYLLTLQNALKAVSPVNRKIRPGQVWLLLIPVFSTIWNFFVVTKISESIEQEFITRGLPVKQKPTYTMGLVMSILQCLPMLRWIVPGLKYILMFPTAFFLVFFIIYWVQVADYKRILERMPPISNEDSQIFSNIP